MLIDLSETTAAYNTFFSDYIDDKGSVSISSHWFTITLADNV